MALPWLLGGVVALVVVAAAGARPRRRAVRGPQKRRGTEQPASPVAELVEVVSPLIDIVKGEHDWSAKPGVKVGPRLERFLDALQARLDFPILVTSGQRTAREQAAALLTKIESHGSSAAAELHKLYAQDNLVDEVLAVPPTVEAIAAVIERQIARGQFMSRHLRPDDAVDLRDKDLSPDQVIALRAAGTALGAKVIQEGVPPHIHMEHLPTL